MEDMKVTASGYDFRPAHAAMELCAEVGDGVKG